MEKRDVVIIGGGPAGRVIVHSLHSADPNLSITLIKDEEINVNRCAVPYGISNKYPIEKFQIPNTLVTDFGAELVIDQATRIDALNRQVQTRNGKVFQYGNLVLATGSRPLVPKIPGIDSELITPVRYLSDLERLREFASKGKRAVVVGGGYIGVEIAVELSEMGLDVGIVEMLPKVLMATTEPEFVDPLEQLLKDHGVKLFTGKKVVSFEQRSADEIVINLDGDESITADFVVLSVGVILNTELAAEAGLEVSPLGIKTDEYLRTSDEHIYASGDCAEKRSFITGKPCRGEFGTNAVFMSRVVAQNILGNRKKFPGVINASATTVFGWGLGQAGLTEKMAQEEGLKVVSGTSKVPDKYPMLEDVAPITTKLLFDSETRKLIGGGVLRKGFGAAQSSDFISLAIQLGATIEDILNYQYATHPEQAAKPSDNSYTFAARDAANKLKAQA